MGKKKINTKEHDMDLLCDGKICINEKGQVTVDLRETDCDPEKAQELLRSVVNNPNVNWKMPAVKLKKKPNIDFEDE